MSGADRLPHFEVHGGVGPHLLLVHGFLSSRAQWLPNLAGLAAFCRPVVVELLGHGRSPAPADDAAYRVAAYVAAFEAIREKVGAERWFVCGQSFGAGLAIRYALTHPRRTLGLVATNSLSAFSPPGDADRTATNETRIETIAKEGRAGLEAIRIHPRHAKRLPEDAKRALVEDAARISLDGVARSWRITSPELSVMADLHRLEAPAVLVNGRWEKKFQPLRDFAVRALPSLRVVDLDGGHSVNMEAPAGFEAAVRALVEAPA